MNKLLISQNLKIFQAMKKLGATGERVLFVVDSKKKLLGTITKFLFGILSCNLS